MLRSSLVPALLLFFLHLDAQPDTVLYKQCSALREIVYQSSQHAFRNILDTRLGGSSGYQVNGKWTFSHEHFSTRLAWTGAANTIIEHATDSRDSSQTESWQYIAAFQPIADPGNASRFYQQVVAQIDECILPLNDSISIHLRPISPEELPATKPDNLLDAYLYTLPRMTNEQGETTIMIGLERLKRGYQVLLMIEVLEEKKKPG